MKKQDATKMTLFALSWPIFIEVMLHMLMGNADTLMLSQYSDDAVAAVGVSNQLLSVMIVMFGFITMGAGILVAQYLGANNPTRASTIVMTSISINLWFSLLLSVLVYLFSERLLALMDLPQELVGEASLYLSLVGGLIFVQALIMTIGTILRSYGYTKDSMMVTIGMNILNVIGNYFVIFGPFGFPVLGVKGVAFVTIGSRFIGLIALFLLLYRRSGRSLPFRSFFSYNGKDVKDLLHIGVPAAGEQVSYNASQITITYFVAQLGTVAITTKVYAQNIMMFIFLSAVAIGQGTQILVGHLVGSRDLEGAYRRGFRSAGLSIAITVSIATIVYFASEPLLHIFTSNEEIVQLGQILLLMTIVMEPGRATNLVLVNSLRATGDVRFPVVVGIISMWGVSVLFAWFFGLYLNLGLPGIWIGLIADEWVRGIVMAIRWKRKTWMKKAFVEEEEATSVQSSL
ncbi:transporter [Pontibacillus halophilus JSM 076056 = DSM 19796]|uniref:Transporter n=1 Tax=Pontibacillus halophilus JSM 076056 = DSM 19796 TaxID=1385510 RepID=A0A0A5GN34_9BACI|nr:MATE family efflux transporter [Pontibacillus halophilus]KGX92648.1 transporter [Pontibacillus halophilus JSM 076056 = DSM 19796]